MRNIYISKLHSFIVGMLSGYTKIAKSQKYMYTYCTKVGHSCYETKNKIFFTLFFNLEWEMEVKCVNTILHEQ